MDANYPASRYPPYFKGPINYSQNSSYNDLYQTTTQQCPPTETNNRPNERSNITQPPPPESYYHSHYKSNDKNIIFDRVQSNKTAVAAAAVAAAACYTNYGHGTTSIPHFKENYYTSYYDQYKYCGGIGIPSANNVGGHYSKSASTAATDFRGTVSGPHPAVTPQSVSHTFQTTKTGIISPCEKTSFPSKLSGTNPPHHPSIHPNANISQYMYGYGGYGTAGTVASTNQHSNQNLCNYSPQNCNDETRWVWDEYQNSRRMVSSSYLAAAAPPPHHTFTAAATNHSLKETSDIYRSNHHYSANYYPGYHSTVSTTDLLSPNDKPSPSAYHHQMSSQSATNVISNGAGENLYNSNKSLWPLSYQTVPPHHPPPQNMMMNPGTYDRFNYYTDGQNPNCCSLNQEKSSSNFYQNYATKYIPAPPPPHSSLTAQRLSYKGAGPATAEMQINCNSYRFMQYNDLPTNMESCQRLYGVNENTLHYDQGISIGHGAENSAIITSKHYNDTTDMKASLNYKEFNMEDHSPLNDQNSYYQFHRNTSTAAYLTNRNQPGATTAAATDSTTSILNRSQNLREFLSSWNEDEDDGIEKIDTEIGSNNINNGSCDNGGGSGSFNDNVFLEHANIEVTNNIESENATLENHLQFRGSFKTRPKIHVGITVDGNISSDQYINLPDIIIDIEKSKDTEINNSCSSISNKNFNKKIDIQNLNEEIILNSTSIAPATLLIGEGTTITTAESEAGLGTEVITEPLNMTSLENLFENDLNKSNRMQEEIIINEDNEKLPEISLKEQEDIKSSDNEAKIKTESIKTEELINKDTLKTDKIPNQLKQQQRNLKKIVSAKSVYLKVRKHECVHINNSIRRKNMKTFVYKKCCKKGVLLRKLNNKRRKSMKSNKTRQLQQQQQPQSHSKQYDQQQIHKWNPISLNAACLSVINSKEFHEYLNDLYRIQLENNEKIIISNQGDQNQQIQEGGGEEDVQQILYARLNNDDDDDGNNKCYKSTNEIESISNELLSSSQGFPQCEEQQQQKEISSLIATTAIESTAAATTTTTEIRWFVPKLSDLCEYALKCYYGRQQFIIKLDDDNDDDDGILNRNQNNDGVEKSHNNGVGDDDDDDMGDENYSNLLFVECDINENVNVVQNIEDCVIGDGIELNLIQVIGADEDDDGNNNSVTVVNNCLEIEQSPSSPTSSPIILLPSTSASSSSKLEEMTQQTPTDSENCNDNDVDTDEIRSQESHFQNISNDHDNNDDYHYDDDNDKNSYILVNSDNCNSLIIDKDLTKLNNNYNFNNTNNLMINNNSIPSILHHEEIVPENYEIFENRKFLKYLQGKYVQQKFDYFRSLIINRILKKYKKQILINYKNQNKMKINQNQMNKKLMKKRKKVIITESTVTITTTTSTTTTSIVANAVLTETDVKCKINNCSNIDLKTEEKEQEIITIKDEENSGDFNIKSPPSPTPSSSSSSSASSVRTTKTPPSRPSSLSSSSSSLSSASSPSYPSSDNEDGDDDDVKDFNDGNHENSIKRRKLHKNNNHKDLEDFRQNNNSHDHHHHRRTNKSIEKMCKNRQIQNDYKSIRDKSEKLQIPNCVGGITSSVCSSLQE